MSINKHNPNPRAGIDAEVTPFSPVAEPSELVSEPVVNESNVECQPKVWSDAPIIEEYESDSEDECVSIPTKQQETPSFANQQVKTPRENVKSQYTHSQKPKVDKKDLGYGFAVRACFVCGSLNHLIRDCDFHEKRMARKAELNNGWNNVQRVNKQNQFVPSAVLTRTGIIPVNTARASILLGEKGKLLLSPQQVVIGDHKDTMVDPNTMVDPVLEIDYPHRALKNKGIVDSGCSRHMTGNKAYLAEFQDFNGGHVAFGGSKGYITVGVIIIRELNAVDTKLLSAPVSNKIDAYQLFRRNVPVTTLFSEFAPALPLGISSLITPVVIVLQFWAILLEMPCAHLSNKPSDLAPVLTFGDSCSHDLIVTIGCTLLWHMGALWSLMYFSVIIFFVVLHGIAWETSGVVVNMEFHNVMSHFLAVPLSSWVGILEVGWCIHEQLAQASGNLHEVGFHRLLWLHNVLPCCSYGLQFIIADLGIGDRCRGRDINPYRQIIKVLPRYGVWVVPDMMVYHGLAAPAAEYPRPHDYGVA
ncbi:hypothetical protein Tco_0547498 [Tanacetum coccineum]